MTDRVKNTIEVIGEGNYDYQRIGGIVLAVCGAIEGLSHVPSRLPPMLVPIIAAAEPWTFLVGFIATAVLVKLGKPVLVQ